MTATFSSFAARLRPLLESSHPGPDPDLFNHLALELFALQFQHNVPYRRFCVARGISPASVRRWEDIPAVPTLAFKEWELTSLPPEARTAVFHSSGTTEQRPSRHFHNADSLELYETSLRSWFGARVPAAQTSGLIILTPPAEQAPHSSLVHMFDVVRRDRRLSNSAFVGQLAPDGSWMLDWEKLGASLREAERRSQPTGILGTAFSFVQLADRLQSEALRFDLPATSWALETGGYKGRSRTVAKAELHRLITDAFGFAENRVISEYGMSELSSQAYDLALPTSPVPGEPKRAFQFPPWARVQIISPETGTEATDGEPGLVRIFDLANVYSVMAVQTEDLGVKDGRGFKLLGRAATAESRGCSLMPGDPGQKRPV